MSATPNAAMYLMDGAAGAVGVRGCRRVSVELLFSLGQIFLLKKERCDISFNVVLHSLNKIFDTLTLNLMLPSFPFI